VTWFTLNSNRLMTGPLVARPDFLGSSGRGSVSRTEQQPFAGGICIFALNQGSTVIWHVDRMPEHYDLTLLHPDGKLGRDIAIMRAEIEELHAKLARMPAVIARAALGIIFSTATITTLLGWWLLAR